MKNDSVELWGEKSSGKENSNLTSTSDSAELRKKKWPEKQLENSDSPSTCTTADQISCKHCLAYL